MMANRVPRNRLGPALALELRARQGDEVSITETIKAAGLSASHSRPDIRPQTPCFAIAAVTELVPREASI